MSSAATATSDRSGGPPRRQTDAAEQRNEALEPGLYVVATPIGNLRDVTLRALAVLGACDLIACEDTRTTAKLLAHHGIRSATTPYHEHNAARARPGLLAALNGGRTVALVSDAGTPLISDPGYRLVRAALDAGHRVNPVPGASAPLAALVAAGLPTDRVLLAGFLPRRSPARRRAIAELAPLKATLVFLESPRRLAGALSDMAHELGPREAAVARELTKRFEELRRGSLSDLAADYQARTAPRGEVVVVVGPPGAKPTEVDLDAHLRDALRRSPRLRDAVTQVAATTGRPRREVYSRALALQDK